ncbi:efflux RND transporter periplasmic adaptor subunit [uncultured Helicobacter sp.]|uniref:efflux RND transporter periplasmic adaptor subunit n=1 Tax=uncultured Helicobacter sp. TaxID=175537 RepID=UPI002607462B|nr:efflux RND transporter periplasmic adaptor subunit [uncultured Helicobacter sp.]
MRFRGNFSKKSLILLCVVVLGVIGVFYVWQIKSQTKEMQNMESKIQVSKNMESKKDTRAILVETALIESGVLSQTYQYVGSLYFSERGMLASEVSGIIDSVLVDDGARVKKGQALAVLNSDLLRDEIASKEGALKQAKAQYEKIKKDYARYKSLYESESISFKEYEDILFDMQAQKGNMESISNALELLKTQERKKTIIAPYDGVVLQKMLKQGEWVNAGASVFNIAKLTPLEATFEVSFEILRSLKVGESLEVQIANHTYQARVSALIPLGDAKARTFPLKLAIEDPKGELIEGLEVRASFNVKGQKEKFLVPRDAILPEIDGNVIFILDGSQAKKVKILVQGYDGLKAFIAPLNGSFSKGDRVIVVGAERLKGGENVVEVRQ